jgi:hypothetical protein
VDKNKVGTNIRCPSCSGQLFPRVLVCDSCGIKIEGEFAQNEFASLTPDELHFLRVFIHCEGRIRDMEAALGVSYPTVKAHLTTIKNKLNLGSGPSEAAPSTGSAGEPETVRATDSGSGSQPLPASSILEDLEQGRLSYKEALKMIKNLKKGAGDAD